MLSPFGGGKEHQLLGLPGEGEACRVKEL